MSQLSVTLSLRYHRSLVLANGHVFWGRMGQRPLRWAKFALTPP